MTIIRKIRVLLCRAGVSMLIMAISPLSGDAFSISLVDDFRETCELIANKVKKIKSCTAECSIATNEKTGRSKVTPQEITTKHLFAERTVPEEASLRDETAKTMLPAPVMINNYRMALEEYLSMVNALLPEQYVLQLSQAHAMPFLKQTAPVAGSLSPADFTNSLQEEKPLFNSKQEPACREQKADAISAVSCSPSA
jgi:hypothetical protein